jgi:signal transduction histidine kinase
MSRLTRHFVAMGTLANIAIFVASLQLTPGYSVNATYLLTVLLAIFSPRPRVAYYMAAEATILLGITMLLRPPPLTVQAMIFSRTVICLTLWLAAFVVSRHRESEAQRAAAETALRDQEALAHLGKMAAVVAHEVRNPLAGIKGAMQVIGRRLGPGSAEHRIANEVVTRIDELNDIVQDMLVFARPKAPTLTQVQVAGVVEDTVSLLKQDPSLSGLGVRIDPTETVVSADPAQLKLALLNLLLNGAQAMQGRGELKISTSTTTDGWHELRIVDDGPGIAPEARAHLFEPFFTTRSRGTGLGLVTARRIVEAHGGTVELHSPGDRGTVAVVRLPAA